MQSDLLIPVSTLLSFLLVLTRLSGMFIFLPMPGQGVSSIARIMLCLSLTLALAPQWPDLPAEIPPLSTVVAWILSEAALGLTVGLAVSFLAEAMTFAAQVLSLQAGYGYASIIDPQTETDAGILLVLAQLLALLLFFAFGMEGHMIRTLAASLRVYPPGAFRITPDIAGEVLRLASSVLSIGLRLALPVAALMILIDLALSVLGKLHSQLQLVQLSFSVKLMLCLGVLAGMLVIAKPLYEASGANVVAFLRHTVTR